MRPRLKKCRAVVKRRDVATQTDPFDLWHPRVILNRMQLQGKSSKEGVTVDKSEIGQLVTVHDKPPRLSRLPNNYRLFAMPITNNENANSTLLLDEEQNVLIHNVAFAKPVPLGCKKNMSKKMSLNLTAPQVRQEPEEAEERNRLEPLIENPQETASTPDMLELNLNVSSIESMIEYTEEATQTAGSSQEDDQGGTDGSTQKKSAEPPPAPNCEDPPGPSGLNGELNEGPAEEPVGEPVGESVREPEAANTTYRMKVNGVTTTITTGTGDEATEESSSDDSVHDTSHHGRRTKFLKIRAHTVNIHNHFYQSQK